VKTHTLGKEIHS